MNFDLSYAIRQFPTILSYTGMTLRIAIVAMVFSVLFSLIITIVRYYRIPVLTPVVNLYIDLFRGTPLLVQLFFIYYGLAQLCGHGDRYDTQYLLLYDGGYAGGTGVGPQRASGGGAVRRYDGPTGDAPRDPASGRPGGDARHGE